MIMEFSVAVPVSAIKTMVGLIKKIVRSSHSKHTTLVYITPKGLYCDGARYPTHLFVPVDLPLGIDGFGVYVDTFESLVAAEGEVVFSSLNKNENDSENENEGESDTEKELSYDDWLRVCGVGLRKGEALVQITYTSQCVPRQTAARAIIGVEIEMHTIPSQMIESSKFLSAVAMCAPYCDNFDGKYLLSSLCLEGDKVIAISGVRLIVAKDVDIDSLVFSGKSSITKGVPNGRFLLDLNVLPPLPKSGSCKLATFTTAYYKESETDVSWLCIVVDDYCIFARCGGGIFPNWQNVIEELVADGYTAHIDPRDFQAVTKRLSALPMNSGLRAVHFRTENGRLGIESISTLVPNTRFQFSENSTGELSPDSNISVDYLCDALSVSTDIKQNPTRWEENDRGEMEAHESPYIFESDIAVVVVMPCSLPLKVKDVANVIDVKEYWQPDKKIGQKVTKKQSKQNSLFANADKDKITALQTENEQLRKENELLKNKIVELSKGGNC
jgi:hypothetical protein